MSDQLNDHDRLLILETQFTEYRFAMTERLGKLNELREAVTSDREAYLRLDVYNARHEELRKRLDILSDATQQRYDTLNNEIHQRYSSLLKETTDHREALAKELLQRIELNYNSLNERLTPLTTAQSRLIGVGLAFAAFMALIGGLLAHLWK